MKKIISIMLTLVLVLSLVACGSSESDDGTSNDTENSQASNSEGDSQTSSDASSETSSDKDTNSSNSDSGDSQSDDNSEADEIDPDKASSIKLDEGQSHFVFSENGNLSMITSMHKDDLESEFSVSFDDSEKDIKASIQTFLDSTLVEFSEFLDVDWNIECHDVNKKGDYATINIVFSDFEFLYMYMWYENLEDLVNDPMNEMPDFVEFKGGDAVDGISGYEDNFAIYINGDEGGSYFEFPGKIKLVDSTMEYERISNTVVLVKEGFSGFVSVDTEIEGESMSLDDILGNVDWDDIDTEDADGDYNYSDIYSGGEAVAGDPNNLEVGQVHHIYNKDNYEYHAHFSADNLEWEVEANFSDSEDDIKQSIMDYYSMMYGVTVDVTDVTKHDNSVEFALVSDEVLYMQYAMEDTLADAASYYTDLEELMSIFPMANYDDREIIDSVDTLIEYIDYPAMYISDDYEGSYFTFSGDIHFVDSTMTWVKVDDNTIYIDDWSYGLCVYEK